MLDFKALYDAIPLSEQIIEVKKALTSEKPLTWQNYYWGVKCIIDYGEDPVASGIITEAIEKAFRNGLSYSAHPEVYKDALKIKAEYYNLYGRYKLASNDLTEYLTHDPNAPAWVYHNLILAQTHIPSNLERKLNSPSSFLSDLAKDDGTNEYIKDKQKNILKEFYKCAAELIESKGIKKVAFADWQSAADTYGVQGSLEWTNFNRALQGKALISEAEWGTRPGIPTEESTPKDARAIERIKAKISFLEKRIQELEALNNEYKLIAQKATERLAATEQKLKEREAQYNETSSRIKRAESDRDELKRKIGAAERKLFVLEEEKKQRQEQIRQLEEKINSLESGKKHDASKDNEYRREIEILKSQLYQKSNDLTKANSKLFNLQKDLDNEQKKANNSITVIRSLNEQRDELQEKLSSLNYELNSQKKTHAHEIQKLNKEIEELKAGSVSTGESEIRGIIYDYIFTVCARYTALWLKKILPQIDKNWWQNCVLDKIDDKAKRVIREKSSHDLLDLNLTPLLSIVLDSQNYLSIHQKAKLVSSAQYKIRDMRDERNKWAHMAPNDNSINAAEKTVLVMIDYLKIVDCPVRETDYLRSFLKEIRAFLCLNTG